MAKDYYSTLGVSRGVADKELRQAYRRLARKYHPDVNAGDKEAEEMFKEINAAYEVLSDPEKRRKYDQFGEGWKHADQFTQAGGGPGSGTFFRQGAAPGGAPFDMGDLGFGSVFSDLFGSRRRSGRSRTVQWDTPTEVPVELSLEEAFAGVTRIVQTPAAMGPQARRIEVKVPAGVDTGSRIHVPAGGGVDLYLVVTIRPHRRFTRKGADLYEDLSIPLVDAILGGEQEVQTLNGKVMLAIPPESQNGQVFRLRNQGMPRLGDSAARGDLFATLKVALPTNLSQRERQLFQELARGRNGRGGGA